LYIKREKHLDQSGLSKRKWYLGDPPPKKFTNSTDDGARDIILRNDNPQEPDLLELDEFMKR